MAQTIKKQKTIQQPVGVHGMIRFRGVLGTINICRLSPLSSSLFADNVSLVYRETLFT